MLSQFVRRSNENQSDRLLTLDLPNREGCLLPGIYRRAASGPRRKATWAEEPKIKISISRGLNELRQVFDNLDSHGAAGDGVQSVTAQVQPFRIGGAQQNLKWPAGTGSFDGDSRKPELPFERIWRFGCLCSDEQINCFTRDVHIYIEREPPAPTQQTPRENR